VSGFAKLVPEIVQSSIWNESSDVRVVWITMLALKDENGFVRGSEQTLTRMANVTPEAVTEALRKFLAPDEHSCTPDDDGRRIEPYPGGWLVLNHDKYREREHVIREQTRLRVKKYRDSKKNVTHGNVTSALPSVSVSASVSASEEGESREGEREKNCFETVWTAYPNKAGKAQAEKAWAKHVKAGTTVQQALDGIKRYVDYVASQRAGGFKDLKYQNGSTFFNQAGWESEYVVDGPTTGPKYTCKETGQACLKNGVVI